MRVLQVNKFLYGRAGAETVMFRTADLLRSNGHNVSFFAMQDPRNVPCAESGYFPRGRYYSGPHSVFSQARSAAASIYSLEARRSLRRLLENRRPDIAHLHNVYHQLTLSVVDELAAQDIPTVMTVHDFKPVCPSYLAYTEHAPCRRCVTGHPGHVIAHRCIKNSRAASTVAAVEALLTRTRRMYHLIDAFIVPSKHCVEVLVEGGLPANRMHMIPNFVADEQFREPGERTEARAPMALFVGRLEEAKGIDVLLAAARLVADEIDVVVVGEGPLQRDVQDADRAGSVRYLGRREWSEIAGLMDRASALVVPSLWEENCPMVVLEAGARGCPVIASDRGGLKELISHGHDGLLFPAGHTGALAAALLKLGRDVALSDQLGRAGHLRIVARNTSRGYLEALMDVYERSI
jgi:glycosyltransferase involved in cell wall biosynthesis